MQELLNKLQDWSRQLGFQQLGVSNIDLSSAEEHLHQWLKQKMQGQMDYMHKHGLKRSRPQLLIPDTIRLISVRMDYLPEHLNETEKQLQNPQQAYISRYALGRDYHKLMRARLKKLVAKINEQATPYNYRVFVDSAPVLEKAIAEKSGLGWIGKHTNLIHPQHGSWFFLAEIYTNLPLPTTEKKTIANHCGRCEKCIEICPTQAIVAPYRLDANKCISYLTIEYDGAIPLEYRKAIGNRIYGCDDCQLCCPWNRFAQLSSEIDYKARHQLDKISLLELAKWNESKFLSRFQGSAIRRIGYQRWQRNIVIALGNLLSSNPSNKSQIIELLQNMKEQATPILQEQIDWAMSMG